MGLLRARNLGKAYKRYRHRSGRLAEWGGLGIHHALAWVLRDVTFDIEPGEAVGIVGANGAGKSTLLKLLSRTVRPTAGTFETSGRVAALLELGIGFHPDFTGRQNCVMAAHIAGTPPERIPDLIDDVVAFAEIGDYFDQPVRTYSSGMQVRLAFSVVTAQRPDILIVDEALSVGDTYFQHKSFDRIRRFRDQGTTLLFVSHSAGTVKTLCSRAILLDHGCVLRDGPPEAVLDYYNAMIAAQQGRYQIRESGAGSGRAATRSGTAEVSIDEVELIVGGEAVRSVRSRATAVVRALITAHVPVAELTAGIVMRDRLGNDVFGTNTYYLGSGRTDVRSGERLAVEFSFASLDLGVGSYSITMALHTGRSHIDANFDWWDRALVFQVVPGDGPLTTGVCVLDVAARWHPDARPGDGESRRPEPVQSAEQPTLPQG
jgi:lipopolysaccharide transport system ATP-binding protein